MPQVVVPVHDRVGPPLVVPIIEAAVFVIMVIIAAKPGPVQRRARPLVLSLFGVLILANAAAAARLVVLVLDGGKVDGVALTADRLLVAGSLVLATNVITFGPLYWQLAALGRVVSSAVPGQKTSERTAPWSTALQTSSRRSAGRSS